MSEKGEVKRDGAKAQRNSGRGQLQKGDALLKPFCIDYKEYPKGFTVNTAAWGKICMDAFKSGRHEPTIKIVLGEGNNKTRLWVIDDGMFQQMRKAWLEKYGE